MKTRQCARSVYGYDWSSSLFLLSFLYLCAFLPASEIIDFHFSGLWINNLFTSDPSSLQSYCDKCLCVTLPLYLKASFSRETLHVTHLLYGYKLYYVGCLSNIGFWLVFSSLVLYFLMCRPTYCLSVSIILSSIFLLSTCGCFRMIDGIGYLWNRCEWAPQKFYFHTFISHYLPNVYICHT